MICIKLLIGVITYNNNNKVKGMQKKKKIYIYIYINLSRYTLGMGVARVGGLVSV